MVLEFARKSSARLCLSSAGNVIKIILEIAVLWPIPTLASIKNACTYRGFDG